jgi:hypothetical protein
MSSNGSRRFSVRSVRMVHVVFAGVCGRVECSNVSCASLPRASCLLSAHARFNLFPVLSSFLSRARSASSAARERPGARLPVRRLRRPERGGEAPPAAPVRDRALHVAVPRAGAVRTSVRNVVGAAEHAAKTVATHLLQSKPVAIHLLQPRDGFRAALRGGQHEVFAGEEQLDGIGEESLAEHLAELVLRHAVAVTSRPI